MSRCPPPETLERLLEEQLSDADRGGLSAHVAGCARCQAALDELTSDPDGVSAAAAAAARPAYEGAACPSTGFLEQLKRLPGCPAVSSPRDGVGPRPSDAQGSGVCPVPGYEILGELGRGGMGVVYKARQVGLDRLVALKMILAGRLAGARDVARFRQEAQAVAGLRHPNIVHVYDTGEADGVPYFVMEYVAGGSLVRRLRGELQSIPASMRLVETLARTVHYAHGRGIVHRDLKPANILLQRTDRGPGADGERSAEASSDLCFLISDLWPKITDFGLAKRLDERGAGTQSGELVGTPSYMAPEQATRGGSVGPAADVYALGALLYECLTGRPPFKGATPLDTVVHLLHEEPVRPARLRPEVPPDLETICLKCLEKDPAKRYASAEALAEDLRCARQGRPIRARPVGPAARAWKWARRRPAAAGLLAATLLVSVLAFAGVTWAWQEARLARDAALAEKREADLARADADGERRKARGALYFSRIAQARLQWRLNDMPGAAQSLARAVPGPGEVDHRGWEWHYLHGLLRLELVSLAHGRPGLGGAVAFTPNGRRLISLVGGGAEHGDAGPADLCVWDAQGGGLLHAHTAPGPTHRLALRPDGRHLALAGTDGTVAVREADTGRELWRLPLHAETVAAVAFSPDGGLLASAGWDRVVKVSDAPTGQVLRVLRGHENRVQGIAFHPDGRRLASAGWDTTIRIWDAHTGAELQVLRGHQLEVYSVAFSPDGALLASAASNGNLRVWDVASGRVVQSVTGQTGAVDDVAFSPDGRYLAYGGGDATARVWDIESGVERMVFRGHTAAVESVHFSPDGRSLASASPTQGAVKVWDLTRHPEYGTFARARGGGPKVVKVWDVTQRATTPVLGRTGPDIEALAFDEGGEHLVSVTVGGRVQLWEAGTGVLKAERSLPACDELVSPAVVAAFSPGGRRLAARARDDPRLVLAWDVTGGAEVAAFRGHTLPVFCVRFSGDGRRLLTCAYEPRRDDRPHEVKVWDVTGGAALASYSGKGQLFNAAFSPDGRRLAVGGQGGTILLIDWSEEGRVRQVAGHKSHVSAVAFSPDGRRLASAELEEGVVKLWELDGEGARETATLSSPGLLCDLTFSPDGRRLAGITRDLVLMWDAETGQEVLTLRGAAQRHWDPAFNPRLAFSPDGRRLAGTNWDETISLWHADAPVDGEAAAHRQAAGRRAAEERAPLWHLEEADDCLDHNNRRAALFHFRCLEGLALPPPLQAFRGRLASRLRP